MRLKTLDCIALTIAIIGAVNWGLIGFFNFNLVAAALRRSSYGAGSTRFRENLLPAG